MNGQLLIAPRDIVATSNSYRVEGVFNPGAIEVGDEVHLLLRVAERPIEQRTGYVPLPRYQPGTGYLTDWVKQSDVSILDPRGVLTKENGQHRFTTISHLRHAVSRDGLHINRIAEKPALAPKEPYEEFGVEDARITRIDDCFYITHVVVSRYGIATALASTRDFRNFERHGIIFPPENKDIVIFPERIGGHYYALHRPNGATPLGAPQIWLARSSDLIRWGHHQVLRRKIERPGFKRFGTGTPPLKVNDGWLVIYHAVESANVSRGPGKYLIYAMLLDLNNPSKILAESAEPILQAADFEQAPDEFKNVIFPVGAIQRDSYVYIYCGANDTFTTVSKVSLQYILESMK